MDEKKIYPRTVAFNIGDEFVRLPRQLNHNLLGGTYPVYGRHVTNIERVSEHKLLVTLGIFNWRGGGEEPSDKAIVGVYGEIDEYVVEDDEFAKIWLEKDLK